MAYHTSIYLFLFLPAVLLVYQLTPKRFRWITLLLSGYIFFWTISGIMVLYLIGTTLFTHYIGVWLAWMGQRCAYETAGVKGKDAAAIKKYYKKKQKRILIFGILLLLFVLVYLKYYNFFAENINTVSGLFGSQFSIQMKTLLLPIGISFYTLQAIGYMADVYWGKAEVSPSPGKLALFLSFFPQIMEGPISMYSRLQMRFGKEMP